MSNMIGLTQHSIAEQFIEADFAQLTLKDQAKLLGISRASLYYQPKPVRTLDLMHRIDKIHTDWPEYGARKIVKQVRRDRKKEVEEAIRNGVVLPLIYSVGRKRVRTLMEEMGIEAVYQKPRLSENNKPHPVFPYLLKNVTASYPNHIWGTDITYIKMRGSYCYLVCFLDWYSRFVVGWKLSTTLETAFVIEAARQALTIGIPVIINSDQGVQYTDEQFITLWNPEQTKISMDHRGRCFDNIFTERFWRTLKYGEVYLKDYQSVWEAERSIDAWMTKYNNTYLHESLGYKPPAEVYLVN